MYLSARGHALPPARELQEQGQTAGLGVLFVRREVEEHVRFQHGPGWVVDRDEFVVNVCRDRVERDLPNPTR